MYNSLKLFASVFLMASAVQAAPVYVGVFEYHVYDYTLPFNNFHLALRNYSPPVFDETYIVQNPVVITEAVVTLDTTAGMQTLRFSCSLADPCVSNTGVSYQTPVIFNTTQILSATLKYTLGGPPVWNTMAGDFQPGTFHHSASMVPSRGNTISANEDEVNLLVGDIALQDIPEPSSFLLLSGAGVLAALLAAVKRQNI